MTPLNYYKTVLRKVSFDHDLFTKEYNKALGELTLGDALRLKKWCVINFETPTADLPIEN